jgi:fumarate reductase subunit C
MKAEASVGQRREAAPAAEVRRRPYLRPASRLWWIERRPYFLFLVRELTSVFVAAYCLFLLYAVYQVGQGTAAYAALLDALLTPLSIVLHLIVLVLVLYHTITWFNLTPKIMVVRRGEEQVSPLLVAGLVYAGWIGFSALVIILVLRG